MTQKRQTFIGKARELFPDASDEDLDGVIWMGTAIPFCDAETFVTQIEELAERANGDIKKALEIADKDIENAMKHAKSQENAENQ